MADETITLKIVAQDLASGNISKFVAGLDTMAKKGGLMGSVLQGVGQSFGQMLNPIGLVSKGIGVLGDVLADSIKAFGESQVIAAQTEAVLKSTGDAAGLTADQVGDLAQSISSYSAQDDEAIQKGENLLLTFTNIKDAAGAGNDIFTQTTKVMVDMAQAMGTDASGAAMQLGKALNDPLRGMSALQRVGVTFSAEQKAMIRNFMAMGDSASAQRVILAELNKEFGGSAKAFGNTLPGAVAKFNNAIGNLEENIGAALAGPMADLANWMTTMMGVVPPASAAVQAQLDIWTAMAAQAPATAEGAQQVGDAIQQSGDKSLIGLLAIEEHLTGLAGLWDQRADAKLWADTMQDLGDKLGLTGLALDNFVQAGITAGQTQDQIRASLQNLVDTQGAAATSIADSTSAMATSTQADLVDTKQAVKNFESAWRGAAVNIPQAIDTMGLKSHAGFKSMLEQNKKDLHQLIHDLKHPGEDKKLLDWLPKAMEKAQTALQRAEKSGDAIAIAEAKALVDRLNAEWRLLHGTITISTAVIGGGAGRVGARVRAHGGPVNAGEAYIVGENQPELFVPSQNGTILPSVSHGAGITIIFQTAYPPSPMEGERIAQALAPHLRREMTRIGA